MPDTTNIFEQTPDLDTFGGRLSRAREAAGLSVKELAWRLGARMTTVTGWESDRSQPDSHRLGIMCGVLNVSLSWLVHGVGDGPTELDPDAVVRAFGERFARLKSLHQETTRLLGRIQADLERLSGPAEREAAALNASQTGDNASRKSYA